MDLRYIKKVSVVFAVKDRLWALENALYSMNRQKTNLPIEFCIYDDNSKINAEPVVKRHLTNFEYKFGRSEKDLYVFKSLPEAFKMVSDESNVIILTSADVIWADDNTIDLLCECVYDRRLAFADVINTPIFPDFWREFNLNLGDITGHWEDYKNYYWSVKLKASSESLIVRNGWNLFSGPERDSWLFYLGAIMKDDLIATGVHKHWCDALLDQRTRMVRQINGMSAVYPGVRAIHQRHNKNIHVCSIIDTCKHHCVKKEQKWAD